MLKFAPVFKTVYVISIVLTGLALTDFVTILILVAGGLAAAVFFLAPNFVIYGSPVLVAMIARRGGAGRRAGPIIAVAGMCLVAVLPGYGSYKSAKSIVENLIGRDTAEVARKRPRHLELIWPRSVGAVDKSAVEEAPCEQVCQKLLTGGEAESVTVKVLNTSFDSVRTVRYTREKRVSCPAVKFEQIRILPYTAWLERRGTCLIPQIDADAPPDAIRVSILHTDPRHSYIPGILSQNRMFVRRVEIIDPAQTVDAQIRFRKTEVKSSFVKFPFHVGLESKKIQIELAIKRSEKRFNPLNYEAILREQLGYTLEVREPEMTLETELKVLIDQSGSEPFSAVQEKLVNDFARELNRQPNLTRQQEVLVRRIIVDSRIRDPFFVGLLLKRRPQLTAQFLPEIVDRISRPVPESRGHSHAAFTRSLGELEPSQLNPYASKISLIIRTDWQWTTAALLTIVGKLDMDPVAILSDGLAADDGHLQRAAVIGVCDTVMKWKSNLRPHLEQYMNGRKWSIHNLEQMVPGILALRRFGSKALADRLVNSLDEKASKRFEVELASFRQNHKNKACSVF